MIPFFLPAMLANNSVMLASRRRPSSGSALDPQPNRYGEEYREQIIRSVIRRAMPSWFGWFNICPLNDAAGVLDIKSRNDAYRFLAAYHCVDRWHIPRDIRRRLPELIREALSELPAPPVASQAKEKK